MSYTIQAVPHESQRMDGLLKKQDPFYLSQTKRDSDRFSRTLPLANYHGSSRPSPTFTCEGRERVFPGIALDMSNLPPLWYDSWKNDKRAGCHKLPTYSDIPTEHLKIFENYSLQLPSQRLKEHKRLKEGIDQWQKGRQELFELKKQYRVMSRNHKSGILGIDAPTRPETELYKERYDAYQAQSTEKHTEGRRAYLEQKMRADPTISGENFPSEPLPRSHDIPIQRKDIQWQRHPYRFFDTHDRLISSESTTWVPSRARAKRSHEQRERHYDILNQQDNGLDIRLLQKQN